MILCRTGSLMRPLRSLSILGNIIRLFMIFSRMTRKSRNFVLYRWFPDKDLLCREPSSNIFFRRFSQKRKIADIILIRTENGRILVKDQPHVYICLSYSGTSIAITVGKRKLGSDIEGVRQVQDKKISASPIFNNYSCAPGKERMWQVIHVWTLVESYSKLYDKNPYPLLNACSPFKDVNFMSYCIDQRIIFSLATVRGHFTDVLVWLDI